MTPYVGAQPDRLDDVVPGKRSDVPLRRDPRKPRLLEELFHLRQVVLDEGQDELAGGASRRISKDVSQLAAELLGGGTAAASLPAKQLLQLIEDDHNGLSLCRLAAIPRLKEVLSG